MIQTSLFDDPPKVVARARRDNPQTSHEAAAQVERSGKATSHRNILANFVKEHPGLTNGELSRELPEIGLYAISKRMGEIARMGLIRRGESRVCSVNGTSMTTWWPIQQVSVSASATNHK